MPKSICNKNQVCKLCGIAHHSPLMILGMLPISVTATMDPSDQNADILLTKTIYNIHSSSKIRVQFVFASARHLQQLGVKVIDSSANERVDLKCTDIDKILSGVSNG